MNTSENSKMRAHKWAKEITHFVNGGDVEVRIPEGKSWFRVENLHGFNADLCEFRIKPQKKTMKVAVFAAKHPAPRPFVYEACTLSPESYTQLSDIVEIEYKDLQT